MAKDAIFSGSREIRTFANLAAGSRLLLKNYEEDREDQFHIIMSSILLTAFTFEAYLNHLGVKKIEFWKEIEQIKVLEKYSVLCKELKVKIDFSRRPNQTVKELFKFRNSIAHGRSEVLEEEKEISFLDGFQKHEPKTNWEEYCNLKNASRGQNDIRDIIIKLHKAAGLGEDPFTLIDSSKGSITYKPEK